MKKNLYYQTVFQRQSMIKEMFLSFFLVACSWPRLVLEVFIRRNMGERYFSLISVLFIFALLLGIPVGIEYGNSLIGGPGTLFKSGLTQIAFAIAFLVSGIKRQQEIARLPSVFDFARFSLSTGSSLPFFYKQTNNFRRIATVFEPGVFFAVGLLLWFAGQYLGTLLMICSVFYSLSYVAAYHQGDNFVMDQIDKQISSEEMEEAFVEGKEPSQTRGFEVHARRPADPELRRKLAASFVEEEEDRVMAR